MQQVGQQRARLQPTWVHATRPLPQMHVGHSLCRILDAGSAHVARLGVHAERATRVQDEYAWQRLGHVACFARGHDRARAVILDSNGRGRRRLGELTLSHRVRIPLERRRSGHLLVGRNRPSCHIAGASVSARACAVAQSGVLHERRRRQRAAHCRAVRYLVGVAAAAVAIGVAPLGLRSAATVRQRARWPSAPPRARRRGRTRPPAAPAARSCANPRRRRRRGRGGAQQARERRHSALPRARAQHPCAPHSLQCGARAKRCASHLQTFSFATILE